MRRLFALVLLAVTILVPPAFARANAEKRAEAARAVAAAYEAGDWAGVVAAGKPLVGDREALHDHGGAAWRLAIALEKVGRQDDARDLYAFIADDTGDPDAMWAAALFSSGNLRESQRRSEEYVKRYPGMAVAFRAAFAAAAWAGEDLRYPKLVDGIRQAETPVPGKYNRGLLEMLRGDLYYRLRMYKEAADQYLHVSSSGSYPIWKTRVLRGAVAAGNWADAARYAPDVAEYAADGLPANPLLLAEARQLLQALQARRDSLRADSIDTRQRRLAANPPPPLDVPSVYRAVQVEKHDTLETRERWLVKDFHLSCYLPDTTWGALIPIAWECPAFGDRNRPLWSLDLAPDALAAAWDPLRNCYAWRPELVVAGPHLDHEARLIIWPNGEVFLGEYRFAAKGAYFSPTKPPYFGLCRYGRPVTEAQRVARVVEEQALEGGESALHVEMADGGVFVGTGIVTEGQLFPTGFGRMVYPHEGAFIGRFTDGLPCDGVVLLPRGRREYLGNHETKVLYGGSGERHGERHWFDPVWADDYTEVKELGGGTWEYFDLRSGTTLTYNPGTGEYSESLSPQRVVEWQNLLETYRQNRAAMRESELRARAEEEERKAAARAAEEAYTPRVSSGRAFQFMPREQDTRCIRCKGVGMIYVPPNVTQGWTYSEVTKSTLDTQVHTSGHMEKCPWCGGTGKR